MADSVEERLRSELSAWEYRYDPETVLIEPEAFRRRTMKKSALMDFLAAVRRERNIVYYVPHQEKALLDQLVKTGFTFSGGLTRLYFHFSPPRCAELADKIERLRVNAAIKHFECYSGNPAAHPGLSQLLAAYLDEHRQTFLDRFGSDEKIRTDATDYHYFAGAAGEPLGFHKFIEPPTGREVEITFGRGTSRHNVAMILFGLEKERARRTRTLEINVPYPRVTALLEKLGFEKAAAYAVMTAKKAG